MNTVFRQCTLNTFMSVFLSFRRHLQFSHWLNRKFYDGSHKTTGSQFANPCSGQWAQAAGYKIGFSPSATSYVENAWSFASTQPVNPHCVVLKHSDI